MKQNYPPKPNTFTQARVHAGNKLSQALWVARFYPVWMCDLARALTQDTGSYLAQFRAVQWFLKPYVTWVDETLDWLEECRQKEWEYQDRQHSSLRASRVEGHIPSAQKQALSTVGPEYKTSAQPSPEAACAHLAEHASVFPAKVSELHGLHPSDANLSPAVCPDVQSSESSFHVGDTCMMDVAGSGINAAASNPDPLMTGLEDYFAACDQASAKCPKKFPPIPEKQRQRMRQITTEFLLHTGTSAVDGASGGNNATASSPDLLRELNDQQVAATYAVRDAVDRLRLQVFHEVGQFIRRKS
ncbi:hypothetical protein [Acetobacter sp. A11-2]|uniref:hypothetical protein n=1 Tax=Acetobacter sp. A11-2 TaxID=3157859 RepID=UPI0032F03DF4